ncbi:MAG: outer membrane beta-barrel protein [Paludibacteraceae bacterium]|nr:outer membrane beta-barrel protein [Paludibacteraceae bacterium]
MKRFIFSLLLIGLPVILMAQFSVRGRVLSAVDNAPVEMTTIRLFSYSSSTDSTFVQGVQTDLDGYFVMEKVAAGNYKLIISNIGFKTRILPVVLKQADVVMQPIKLDEDVQFLEEVSVKGHAAEMTVKGDTIEYNTSAYKVNETDMVEELLKKMSGIEVDNEGNVTVNGEAIKGIRIDGKKFFGNDVQSATKNIPADMVDKIQVIDQKSETAKLTGFDDDESERIINLTLKSDRKKGVFGNYNLGVGMDMVTDNGGWFDYANPAYGATSNQLARHFFANDFRYEAGLFTNILAGESQTTIIGGANNTNQIRMGRGRGGFGQQNQGITWSENIGINTNIDLGKNIVKKDARTSLLFGGDVAFSHSNNDSRTQSEKESYSPGATYHNTDSTGRMSTAWDVNLRLELEYQIDTLNMLLFQPGFSYTQNIGEGHNEYRYYRDSDLVSDGYQNQSSDSRDISANMKINYNHRFYRPGRSLTLTGSVDFTNTVGYAKTYSWDNILGQSKVDQYTNSGNDKIGYSIRASYVEPIHGNNHLMEFALSFSGNSRQSVKDQMSMDLLSNEYKYDSTYSNNLTNRFFSEAAEVNYRWISEQCDLTVGLKLNPSQTRSINYYGQVLTRDTLLSVWNWSPNASFKYKFGKRDFARIIYRGSSTQPSINQMEPVRNNSNAMNETLGNLGLQPSFRHTLRFMYSKFNQESFSSIMCGLQGNLTKDALVNNSIYDETGKLYQQTVNAESLPYDIGANFMYNTPFANKLMQFNTRTDISYNRRIAYTTREMTSLQIAEMIESGKIQLGNLSQTGNLQLRENLSLRFTHDIVEIGVNGNFTYSRTDNSINPDNISNVFNWGVTGDIAFHLPKKWNIAADCGYTARYGYQLKDVNEVILNAQINKSWQNATLSLQVYDILHQKKNIVQVINDNSVQYKKFNTLPTYFMLTFTYKFNKMGDLKATGMAGYMQEMMESGSNPSKGPQPGRMPR